MFETALNIHDPGDKRSHSILRFFSEDLTEDKKIEFVKSIFNRGAWTLSTEISRTSKSTNLSEETKNIFKKILEKWVQERIEHSNKLTADTKNPYLPRKYSYEFREAIIAIKDLGFHQELMVLLEKFLNECYRTYLDKFIDGAFWLVIEDFSSLELEKFFLHFSNLFLKNSSDNIGDFLYAFLRSLAYSPKIFFLSKNFLQNLNHLSYKIKELGSDNNHSLLISVLLIELITLKELDLSKTEYVKLILPTINKLEGGNLDNLELLSFLHKFNYKFESYNFKEEIELFFNSIEININKIEREEETSKKAILHHFVKSSNEYLDLLLFQLKFINKKSRIIELKRFINLIDRLRASFMEIMWFKEFDNFVPIKGEIVKALPDGFGVKLDTCYINDFLNRQALKDIQENDFFQDNSFGFANKKTFKKNTDVNEFYSYLKQNSNNNNYYNKSLDSISKINLFHISGVNYSSSNKGSVINLMPFSESIYNLLTSHKIKLFFSCIDLFLVNEAFNLLKEVSPFANRQYSPVFRRLLPSLLKSKIKLDFNNKEFWAILKEFRPNIYNETYIKTRENERLFEKIIEFYNQEKIIQGTILSRTKGGFYVNIEGYQAFLPGSQIKHYSIPDYDAYINKTMDFKIVKIYHEFKSAVISHKVIYDENIEKQKSIIISTLDKGLILSGIVKNITSYGVFMDLGGVDGLIHITDLSWARVNHPSEIVELGEKLNVVILDFDKNKSRIQLGLKQLFKDPWGILENKLKVGDKVKGIVVLIVNYGAFIEVESGVEGLIHVSEMSWSTNYKSVHDHVKLGDKIEAQILTLDTENHKMSLGIKQLQTHPWNGIDSKISKGDLVKGTISKKISSGVVIEILPGVEGFAHISKITNEQYLSLKEGQVISAKVLFFKASQGTLRLSLDFKRKENRNCENKRKQLRVGDIFEGKVIKVNKGTGVIKVKGNNIAIICPSRHMKNKDGKSAKINDKIKFKLLEKNKFRLIVSHTASF